MRRKTCLMGLAAMAALPLTLGTPAHSATTAPTCMGHAVTIMGTPGDDHLVGSPYVSDVIYGDTGNDSIDGGNFYNWSPGDYSPPDYLCGASGNDFITDSPGNDHLNGGDGNDTVRTYGYGKDVLRGNLGDDRVEDWSCADCGTGNAVLHGNEGNDTVTNGWGRDQDFGDAGADTIIDEECDGPTTLNGGSGNDYLESWSSSFEGWHGNVCSDNWTTADVLTGGTGTDTAQADKYDKVTYVEYLTRITQPTQ